MRIITFGLAALLFASAAVRAEPVPAPTPAELHAAECVAALEVDTERLAKAVKAGRSESQALLQSRLESGTAFVGEAYLNGTRDEARARELANDALEAQKRLSSAELAARQLSCAAEGMRILDASNVFERAVVRQVAKRRMAKLLAD